MRECTIDPIELKAYLDGEMSWFRRFRLYLHITRCVVCRRELEMFGSISERLVKDETSRNDSMPESLRRRILESVQFSDSPVETKLAPKSRFPLALMYTLGSASAAVLVLLVFLPKVLSPTNFKAMKAAPNSAPMQQSNQVQPNQVQPNQENRASSMPASVPTIATEGQPSEVNGHGGASPSNQQSSNAPAPKYIFQDKGAKISKSSDTTSPAMSSGTRSVHQKFEAQSSGQARVQGEYSKSKKKKSIPKQQQSIKPQSKKTKSQQDSKRSSSK